MLESYAESSLQESDYDGKPQKSNNFRFTSQEYVNSVQDQYDGYIGGGDSYDAEFDGSGELISIEDTYKEIGLYKRSGSAASNDALTKAAQQVASADKSRPTLLDELKLKAS